MLKFTCAGERNSQHNVCNRRNDATMFWPMESLKERRERTVGRQIDLAEKCGCHHSHISHIESGRVDPSLEIFVKMIEALDVSPAKGLEMLKMRSAKQAASVTDLRKERERRSRR